MQGSETYRFIVRRGPQPNQVYELTADVTNLGRDITNDIVINDREVSRHHLRLALSGEGCSLEDLGSTNGTFINGKRLTGAIALKNGDMIGLGETVTLQFEVARAGGVAPQPEPPAEQQTVQSASSDDDDMFKPRPPEPQQPASKPAAPADNPYEPAAPAYQAPAPQQQQPAQADYQPPAQPDYQPQQDYQQQQDPYYAPAGSGYAPPPPGYDYDPYAMRDEEGGGMMQWFLIGCLGLLLLCCCLTVVLAVAVDTFCLYDSIPFLNDALQALGQVPQC